MKRLSLIALAALLVTPSLAHAQLDNLEGLLDSFGDLVAMALPIVAGLALLAFFWGLVIFIFAQSSEERKADGKKIMIWSVVALFVMVSVWGLVRFIQDAFDIDDTSDIEDLPSVPGLDS
jgi:hypothetical protein